MQARITVKSECLLTYLSLTFSYRHYNNLALRAYLKSLKSFIRKLYAN
jgi:hypothetical protein